MGAIKSLNKGIHFSYYCFKTLLWVLLEPPCIHVIPPSSSGRLQEMIRKNWENSSKMYHFFTKIKNLPEMNQEFSYIFYTFFKNLPEMEEKSP